MKALLGIDLGTSGVKAALFDTAGNLLCSHTENHPLYQPQNGWAEQDPLDWWQGVCASVSQVLKMNPLFPADIVGVGLSGQMHGLVLLDADGEVLRPAILWCDSRTGAECRQLTEQVGAQRLLDITLNPALTGFTASKILWVQNYEPEIWNRVRHILLPKDYIRYRLCGVFAGDMSDGSGMQLMDIANRCWSPEVCKAMDVPMDYLPKLHESPEITGAVTAQAARATGLPEGMPVVAGAGDNAASAVGMGVVRDGTSFTTIGTSGVVFSHTSGICKDPKGRVHTFCCAVPGAWHVMGVTQAAGLSLQWFKNEFCQAESEAARQLSVSVYKLIDEAAEQSPLGANRLLYLPYLMGERTPHLDPNCRGSFIGLSAIHKKRDMARAVMEGVSFSLRDCVEVLREMGVSLSATRMCGGGGSSAFWRQMLADVLNIPVQTLQSTEGAALGAALLAGVGTGVYDSVPSACDKTVLPAQTLSPITDNHRRYETYYQTYRMAYPALSNLFARLSSL